MKKVIYGIVCVTMAVLMTVGCIGCFGGKDKNKEPPAPQEYTIQYSDESGAKQITVTQGQPYSLDVIPEKTGYDFMGLYDAEAGGTQYVTASGSSVAPFTDGKSIVLYAQFKAKEYTVVLDYQGAAVTGDRQITVAYNASLPELPKNLTLEHKNFTGWYTQENRKGVQVADQYGLLPKVSVVNETNFTLTSDGYLYLYAGFEIETFDVTCYFDAGMAEEIVKVAWNTPVGKIVTKTRKNGEAPLTWSKSSDRQEIFNGNIVGETVLYAVEYAPVIDFDTDGGDEINAVVARAGAPISLPTPTKDGYKFVKWETLDGKTAEYSTMPSKSVTLKAVWQAKIVFDSNGGSKVDDISVAAGESITLPTPEKEGFIFAGWYTADKEKYESKIMPSTGMKLKAGWYIKQEKSMVLVENDLNKKLITDSNKLTAKQRIKIDLSDSIAFVPSEGISVDFKISFRWGNTYKNIKGDGQIALYESESFTSSNQLGYKSLSHGTDRDTYCHDSLNGTAKIHTNILYLYYCGKGELQISLSGGYGGDVAFYDINMIIAYPDTTNLYL